jgi:hypothetical protein
MGFRSFFREHAPEFQLLEPLTTVRVMADATDRDRAEGAAAHVLPFVIYTAENV